MYDRELFVFTKQLDPLGLLTKSGTLLDVAAVCATDFDPVSQNGIELTREGLKGLLDCEEGGGYPARYHQAVLKAGVPRMFAVNGDTDSSMEAWFLKHDVTRDLGALVKKDADTLRMLCPDSQAICRRVVVFRTPRVILEDAGKEKLAEKARTRVSAGLERLAGLLQEARSTGASSSSA